MISQEKQQTETTFKSLIQERRQHQSAQSELEKQRSELQQRGVFLERLSSCLNEGPTVSLLSTKEKDLFAKETELIKQKEELERLRMEQAMKEAAFVAREEAAHRKEASIQKSIEQGNKGMSLLEQKASQLKEHATHVKKAEADIMNRVSNLNKREEDLAAREKDVSKMMEEVRGQQFRFAEVREKHREMFLKEVGDVCATYDKCDTCRANPKCGWCASSADGSQGRCLSHNVNAKSDGLTSGQCPLKSWFSKVSDRVTAMNLNVFGADLADKEQRANALFNTIIAAKYPDFVAFQEVNQWFLDLLKQQRWFKAYYHITHYDAATDSITAPGGLAIMSRFTVSNAVYSEQAAFGSTNVDERPRLLTAEVELSGRTVTVATTTLDWRNSQSRVQGLKFIRGVTHGIDNLLLLGDFNFDEGAEPESSVLPTTLMDIWTRLHTSDGSSVTRGPNKFGFTWDPVTNWYARYSDPNSRPSRIDRIFLRSTVMLPREIHLVGCSAPDYLCQDPPSAENTNMIPFQPRNNQVPGNVVYPSSHYGLLATFSVFTPHC